MAHLRGTRAKSKFNMLPSTTSNGVSFCWARWLFSGVGIGGATTYDRYAYPPVAIGDGERLNYGVPGTTDGWLDDVSNEWPFLVRYGDFYA